MLREARTRRGWSQSQLARRSGVSQSVISAYESGAREPSVAALRRLGRAMDLDLAFVAARTPRGPDPSVMAKQLEDVLGLVDAMRLQPRARPPLRYPVLSGTS
ncbi:MAG TPA: helix-turn-helix transcriptional regulator [Acidimicrobiia bacterium]|nr:helix-turn-helix transcriptional regulator [Acidimicrobiia bacterium]